VPILAVQFVADKKHVKQGGPMIALFQWTAVFQNEI
jgi:hypothetical protein